MYWKAWLKRPHIVFDKTGTLTEGNLSLKSVIPLGQSSYEDTLAIACALEAHSEHPIAKPFHVQAKLMEPVQAAEITNHLAWD